MRGNGVHALAGSEDRQQAQNQKPEAIEHEYCNKDVNTGWGNNRTLIKHSSFPLVLVVRWCMHRLQSLS